MNVLSAQGLYFDGICARPDPVTLRIAGDRLVVSGSATSRDWRLSDLRSDEDRGPVLRIGPSGAAERIEIADEAFTTALRGHGLALERNGGGRGGALRILGLSFLAMAMLFGLANWGVPRLSDRLAPLIPFIIAAHLSDLAEKQLDLVIGKGGACHSPLAQVAMERLVAKLAPGLSPTSRVRIRLSPLANALALPDGRIVIFSGLIAKARTPDEFAGVLAHELGHVAAHDPVRGVIHDAGNAILLSYIVGDMMGATMLATLGKDLITASYSREAEWAADRYAVAAVSRAGGNGAALAAILERIDSDSETPLALLRTHPISRERTSAIRSLAADAPHVVEPGPLLDPPSWAFIQAACSPIEAL